MRDRLLKWMIYLTGAIGLYIFLAIRIEPLFNLALKEKILPEYWENTKYGELYYVNNFIKDFREKNLPHHIRKYRHSEKHPGIEEADILIYGDSFLDFSRMVTLPERMADTLQKKVYYRRMIDDHQPLTYLKKINYTNNEPRVFIYETSESFLEFRFRKSHDTLYRLENRNMIRKTVTNVIDWWFMNDSEVKYSILLQRSLITGDLYSEIATFKFRKFQYITESTPLYSLDYDSPWLFYGDDVNPQSSFFYHPYTDEEIDNICNNIASLSAALKRRYNMEFIFFPIPAKYTIYHKLVNHDPYSGFLPRIYKGLHKRGVPVINLYDIYNNSPEILYYGTDTHWNKKGMEIALKETLRILSDSNFVKIPESPKTENNVSPKLISAYN